MKKMTVLVVTLCLTALLGTTAGSVDVPEWEVGQSWAMGLDMDMSELYDDMWDMLCQDGSCNVSYDGEMSYYQKIEVVEKTEDEYVLSFDARGIYDLTHVMEMESMMMVEGTYSIYDHDIPMEMKKSTTDMEMDMNMNISAEFRLEKDTLAVISANFDLNMVSYQRSYFSNMIDMDQYWGGETMTISYKDYNMSMHMEVNMSLEASFDPPLDIFNFPLSVGNQWEVESSMTLSGKVSTSMDIDHDTMFYVDDDLDIEEVLDTTIPIHLKMECTGTEMLELEDGSTEEVYLIKVSPIFDPYGWDTYIDESWYEGSDYEMGFKDGYEDGFMVGELDAYYGDEYDDHHSTREANDYYLGYVDGYTIGYHDGYHSEPYDDTIPTTRGVDPMELYTFLKYSPSSGFVISQEANIFDMGLFTGDMGSIEMMPIRDERRSENTFPWFLMITVIIIVLISVIAIVMKGNKPKPTEYYSRMPDERWQQPPQL